MIVFLDFEASSLGKKSWPVEVAWVFEDGRAESYLVKPAQGWTDWAESAERIHGISRMQLAAEGVEPAAIGARMMAVLAGCRLYATAPSWDGKWLSVLLRGAGLPRHALRLEDTLVAHRHVVREVLAAAGVPAPARATMADTVLATMARRHEPDTPIHRALPDAQRELALLAEARTLATEAAAGWEQAG